MAGRAADSAGAPASKPRLKSCRAAVRSLQEQEDKLYLAIKLDNGVDHIR